MSDYEQALKYLDLYLKENPHEQINKLKYLEELKKGRPIQYIIGNVNFYGNIINVNESVLIPRFETELLVDKSIQKIKQYFPNQKIDLLDLGTGSGCIAISIGKIIPSNIDAIDISIDALKVASYNAKQNQVNINFINTDMTSYQSKKYDVIISNPPYLKTDEPIMELVKNNEPHLALYASDEGLYFYKKIIDNLPNLTKDKYLVCFEAGEHQSTEIVGYTKKRLGDINISVEKDYSDKERFIFISNIK